MWYIRRKRVAICDEYDGAKRLKAVATRVVNSSNHLSWNEKMIEQAHSTLLRSVGSLKGSTEFRKS